MEIKGWRYYNHAVIPTTAPHEDVNLAPLKDGTIWKVSGRGKPVLCRWTTDYYCGFETQWWYTIIDTPFEISSLKSDYRRRIKIGLRNFQCRIIDVDEYALEMSKITKKDWETYPLKYKPNDTEEQLCSYYQRITGTVWGAFDENDKLCAFQIIDDYGIYYSLAQGKSLPDKQKFQVNAALIFSYLGYYAKDIEQGKYISNGTRNIIHETNFNEDLCKKYGFRKAYCRLKIKYRFPVGLVVKLLYPFRRKISINSGIGNKIYGMLRMEEISRHC